MITPAVERLRDGLGYPGMVVLQFAFDDEHSMHRPEVHVENRIVYTGTHDHDTVRGWYESASPEARARADAALDRYGVREPEPHWSLIRLAFASPAVVAMVQAQDVLGLGSEGAHEPAGHHGGRVEVAAWPAASSRPTSPAGCARRPRRADGWRSHRLGCSWPAVRPPPRLDSPEILDVNRRYHDVAAREYDAKWGISFGETGQAQVVGKLAKLLGPRPGPVRALAGDRRRHRVLLAQPAAGRRGRRGGRAPTSRPACSRRWRPTPPGWASTVETAACDAAELPFEDDSFDLVLGHAVLHHLPALDRAFAEFRRVLRPGGTVFFAGEPSAARRPHRGGAQARRVAAVAAVAPRDRRRARRRTSTARRRRRATTTTSSPWSTCTRSSPRTSSATRADAGFAQVRVGGEELLANWFGWFNRTLEASADPRGIPMPWIRYAYHGYLLLQGVDRRLLEGRLPPQLFYNLMLAASKPES